MISLEVDFYKYGHFRETQIHNFNNEVKVYEWMSELKEYDDYVKEYEKKYEPLTKWQIVFYFKDVKYEFDIDE